MYLEVRQLIFKALQAGTVPGDKANKNVITKLNGIMSHQTFSTSSFFTYSKQPKSKGNGLHKTVFFPGCALPAYSPELALKTYRYLREKIPGVGIILNCCGKPSDNIGDERKFNAIFTNTMNMLSRLGVEEVIMACINCLKIFSQVTDVRFRTIYQVMVEMGLPKIISGNGQQISIHDACPARYRPEVRNAVRQIALQSDYEIVEMPFSNEVTLCCGAGGCAPCGNSDLANSHMEKRTAQSKGQLVSYCSHCRESFSAYVPSLHILDMVFRNPNLQRTRERNTSRRNWMNRWYLKKRLQLIN
jgi:Fe-S oxidoreductase